MHTEMNFDQARTNMIKQQFRTWDILDDHLLDIMAEIPREHFIPENYHKLAFVDMPTPLGNGLTTMPPKAEARALQALRIQPSDKILQVGLDCGYLTAVLARLGAHVYGVDAAADVVMQVTQKLSQLETPHKLESHVTLATDACNPGEEKVLKQRGPFDVIIITASLEELPEGYRKHVAIAGRLFCILGNAPAMQATLIQLVSKNQWTEEIIFETVRPRLTNAKQVQHFEF